MEFIAIGQATPASMGGFDAVAIGHSCKALDPATGVRCTKGPGHRGEHVGYKNPTDIFDNAEMICWTADPPL